MEKLSNFMIEKLTGYTVYSAENLNIYLDNFTNLKKGRNGLYVFITGQYYLETDILLVAKNQIIDLENKMTNYFNENLSEQILEISNLLNEITYNLLNPQYHLRNIFQEESLSCRIGINVLKRQNQYSEVNGPSNIINPIFEPIIVYSSISETHFINSWQNILKPKKRKQNLSEIIELIPQTN